MVFVYLVHGKPSSCERPNMSGDIIARKIICLLHRLEGVDMHASHLTSAREVTRVAFHLTTPTIPLGLPLVVLYKHPYPST